MITITVDILTGYKSSSFLTFTVSYFLYLVMFNLKVNKSGHVQREDMKSNNMGKNWVDFMVFFGNYNVVFSVLVNHNIKQTIIFEMV